MEKLFSEIVINKNFFGGGSFIIVSASLLPYIICEEPSLAIQRISL